MKRKWSAALSTLVALSLLSACSGASGTSATSSAGASSAGSAGSAAGSADASSAPGSSSAGASGASGAATAPAYLNMEGAFPITKEIIEVKGFANRNASHNEFNKMQGLQKYEEMTNMKITWTDVPSESYEEKKNIMLASGDYPDFFWRGSLTSYDEVSYGSQGVLIPLGSLIEQYGPNLTARFDEQPVVRKSITQPDGNIYTLPQANNSQASLSQYSWINQEFLDNLNLELPATTDAFFDVMNAIAHSDANKNGQADEIALSSRDKGKDIFKQLCGSWGLGNLGVNLAADFIDRGPDGKARFYAADPLYKELIEYIKKMWDAGIIDKEIFTQGAAEFTAKGDKNTVGAFLANNNPQIIGSKNSDKYVTIPAMTGPHGDKLWVDIQSPVQSVAGSFAITSKCKYPEAMLRWVDYWYGEEGSVFLRMGIENVTYTKGADGALQYTDEILKNSKGLTTAQAMGQYTPGIGGGLAHFIFDKYERIRLEPVVFTGLESIKNDLIPESVILTFTLEEQDRLKALSTDIRTFVEESRVKFVTGADSLDNWDKYVNQIGKMGVDELVKIYSTALDRYYAS